LKRNRAADDQPVSPRGALFQAGGDVARRRFCHEKGFVVRSQLIRGILLLAFFGTAYTAVSHFHRAGELALNGRIGIQDMRVALFAERRRDLHLHSPRGNIDDSLRLHV
jgi:hypothetical protein